MTVKTIEEAWEAANKLFPTDYQKDEESSQRAGYPIYRSTAVDHFHFYICDLNDRLDLELESEDYDSLGGFLIQRLDRLPEVGDEFTTEDGIRMVVDRLDKNRVELVHLYLPEKENPELDEDEEEGRKAED